MGRDPKSVSPFPATRRPPLHLLLSRDVLEPTAGPTGSRPPSPDPPTPKSALGGSCQDTHVGRAAPGNPARRASSRSHTSGCASGHCSPYRRRGRSDRRPRSRQSVHSGPYPRPPPPAVPANWGGWGESAGRLTLDPMKPGPTTVRTWTGHPHRTLRHSPLTPFATGRPKVPLLTPVPLTGRGPRGPSE